MGKADEPRLEALHREAAQTSASWNGDVSRLESGRAILAASPAQQLVTVLAAFRWCKRSAVPSESRDARELARWKATIHLLQALLRGSLPFDAESLEEMLELAFSLEWNRDCPVAGIVLAAETYTTHSRLNQVHVAHLERALGMPMFVDSDWERRVLRRRAEILAGKRERLMIKPGEAWSDEALRDLDSMGTDERARWDEFLHHANEATSSKPTERWLKAAGALLDALGKDRAEEHLNRWLRQLGEPCTSIRKPYFLQPTSIDDDHVTLLKGLAWSCAALGGPEVIRTLAEVADVCFNRVSVNTHIGEACVAALGRIGSPEAVSELLRLEKKTARVNMRKATSRAVDRAAARAHTSADDLAESSISSFGLDSKRTLQQRLGTHVAEIRLSTAGSAALTWSSDAGKALKGVPAAVRRDSPSELNDLQRTARDIETTLSALKARLEGACLKERTWTLEEWRRRYVDHPVLSVHGHRLLWSFGEVIGGWLDGRIVNAQDSPLDIAPGTQVRLWHPIESAPDVVLSWRDWLLRHQISQPFKQAYREIYLLTDAEAETATYSNRFAGHILRQHQMAALGKQRGWQVPLLGHWDNGDAVARVALPRHKLRAEFWTEANRHGPDSDSGLPLYITTDQVRFYAAKSQEPMHLTEVPLLVFSEVMRDVDLFVGVSSIGNDPGWQDTGARDHVRYWHRVLFGDLSPVAETRRAVLERLLPRLKISTRCTLDDRSLVVRGQHRTYKIHLGSGAILMEPNDQHLCIVPDRSRPGEEVFLPFEGDATLSVILSKAFLLAEDDRIEDPSIRSQICR